MLQQYLISEHYELALVSKTLFPVLAQSLSMTVIHMIKHRSNSCSMLWKQLYINIFDLISITQSQQISESTKEALQTQISSIHAVAMDWLVPVWDATKEIRSSFPELVIDLYMQAIQDCGLKIQLELVNSLFTMLEQGYPESLLQYEPIVHASLMKHSWDENVAKWFVETLEAKFKQASMWNETSDAWLQRLQQVFVLLNPNNDNIYGKIEIGNALLIANVRFLHVIIFVEATC